MKKRIIAAAILLALFIVFTVLTTVVDVMKIGPDGTEVGFASLNGMVRSALGYGPGGYSHILYKITQFLGYAALLAAGAFVVVLIVQFIRRKSVRRVDGELFALMGLYVLTAGVYAAFEFLAVNFRPVVMAGETAPEASYPSSHTVLACVVFVSAASVIAKYIKKPVARVIAQDALLLLAALTVALRAISGVHWITDIIGGLLISAALLFAFEAAVSLIDGKRDAK